MRRRDDGAMLKRARLAAALSQGELAYLANCSHTTIYLLEKAGPRGMSTCSDDLAYELARRLGRDVEDLFEARSDARRSSRVRRSPTVSPVAGVTG